MNKYDIIKGMNFKRLELVGFKSFADKTIIEFDSGTTAIVGPNGCGKSNVADSIRWVLGEQSSKLLRGSNMQDVIFAGTENRKSLSYAEVTMVLDNSDRTLNIDYNEVALTRKLYRSGDSEYLINNTQCRLKDIVDILHDSGMGRDGYSIIGQGKVSEIVNAKPESRRVIFEEAAGISKFKARKIEASRKLERTRDNLSRARDILSEIERQLTPLKNQAENAKKYLNLKEILKRAEINNYIYQYDNASSNKEEISLRIKAIDEETALKTEDLNNVVLKYNESFDKIQNIDRDINKLYGQMIDLKVELEKSSSEVQVYNEKLNSLNQDVMRINVDLNNFKNSLVVLNENLNAKTSKKQENLKKVEDLNLESEEIRAKYLSVVDELTKSEDLSEQNQRDMFNALSKLSDYKAEFSKLTNERENNQRKLEEIDAEINSENLKNLEFSKQSASINVKLADLNKNKGEIKDKVNYNLSKYNENILKLRNVEEKILNLNNSLATLSSRKKLLTDLEKDYEGFNNTVKNLLKQSEENKALSSKFVGVVANLMQVPQMYETAIEMALGNAVQNVVTENETQANEIIDHLKQNKMGRATFLPLTSLKPRRIDERFLQKLKIRGCYGVASNLISYDKKLSNIFESLLGATVIVNDLPLAISLAKECSYSFKIVTLEGDIINPAGSITGGSKKSSVSNIIGRAREIEEIDTNLLKLEAGLKENQKLKDSLLLSNEEYQNSVRELNEKLRNIELEIATESEKQTALNAKQFEIESETKLLKESYNKINGELTELDSKIIEIEAIIKSVNTNQAKASSSINQTQLQFTNLKQERDNYNEKITQIKVQIATLNSENLALTDEEIRLNNEIENASLKITECEESLSKLTRQIDLINAKIEASKNNETYKRCEAKIKEVQAKLDSLDDYKAKLQATIKELEEDRVNFTTHLTKLQNKRNNEELNLTKIDTELENMQERVWEEYELTYSSALEYKVEDYNLHDGLIEANKTKREIDKLGYVNVNAIEESIALNERYTELNAQIEDLTKAEEDTSKVIRELNSEMVNRFTSEFEKINTNFKRIFKELFGGGSAELILVKPEKEGEEEGSVCDILEAGVDIIAQPPGKSLKNLSLLSGGEMALTAIAILFAILKLKPMPFCLLDEIEAALDDANVFRFAKYLKRFSSETQFIVITHRKPTMELADRLYGVTMQEKGVSKIVSVKLSDIEDTL